MRHLQSAFLVLLIACAGCLSGTAFARVVFSVGSELSQIQQLIQNGHNVEALGRVRQALAQFPGEPNLYNFLGVLEAQASNYLAAEASFRRAIELAPMLTPAYFNLGRLYQENSGKDPQAISKAVGIYKTLLTQQPGNAEARYECARLVCLQGKFEDALSQVSRLPAADQKVSHVLIVSLTAYAGLGRRALADEAASQLLSFPFFPRLASMGKAQQSCPCCSNWTSVPVFRLKDCGNSHSSMKVNPSCLRRRKHWSARYRAARLPLVCSSTWRGFPTSKRTPRLPWVIWLMLET
jgi:Tfp pilus assembly protein PilF